MSKQKSQILSILMLLVVISESSVIVKRYAPKESSSGDGELERGKKLESSPEYWDGTFGKGLKPSGQPAYPDYDEGENEIDVSNPEAKPERFPSYPGREEIPDYGDSKGETPDYDSYGPFEGEEDFDKSVGDNSDPELPVFTDGDESHKDEENEHDEEYESEIAKIPIHGFDEGFEEGEMGPGEGSIFDSPFFNLEQVRKYFHQLEKILGYVFRETMDETLLSNGTYANITEEEVDIDGKTYIVQKSIVKNADNDSTIYFETLSSKPKDEEQRINGMDVKKEEEELQN